MERWHGGRILLEKRVEITAEALGNDARRILVTAHVQLRQHKKRALAKLGRGDKTRVAVQVECEEHRDGHAGRACNVARRLVLVADVPRAKLLRRRQLGLFFFVLHEHVARACGHDLAGDPAAIAVHGLDEVADLEAFLQQWRFEGAFPGTFSAVHHSRRRLSC